MMTSYKMSLTMHQAKQISKLIVSSFFIGFFTALLVSCSDEPEPMPCDFGPTCPPQGSVVI